MIYLNRLTDLLYEGFKFPFPVGGGPLSEAWEGESKNLMNFNRQFL